LVHPARKPRAHPRFPDHLLSQLVLPAIRAKVRPLPLSLARPLTRSCTTFLLAAEIFPISVRATAHGLSAASGKLGALLPAVIYNYVDVRTRFWIVCWFGFAGWIVTWLFVPDTTGLDLREQDRYWQFVRAGRAGDYHGIAVHPRHLSVWERVVLGRHKAYDPEADRVQRVGEMRAAYEEMELKKVSAGVGGQQAEEKGKGQEKREAEEAEEEEEEEAGISGSASTYFASECRWE
jgi:hypothetical protein